MTTHLGPRSGAAEAAAKPETPLEDITARGEGDSVRMPTHPVHAAVTIMAGGALTILCLAWAANVPYLFGTAFYLEQFLALILGLALMIAFCVMDWRGEPHRGLSIPDLVLGTLGLCTSIWIAINYDRLVPDMPYRPAELLVLSIILVVLVVEGLRRATGWGLFGVVMFFLVYAMLAHLMPLAVRGKQQVPDALLVYLGFDPSAIFGTPLVVGATVVIMYIWLGEMLAKAGGGEFFMDVAMATMGRRRGGPAKMCVVGSAMFGTISGSAVSSVASVGVFTIPLMKRSGYSARDAGAIEAVASTGGQLDPPVMGAAAFLMAEFIQVPYAEVALAATIPAMLYYWGLYWQVDLIAGRDRLQRLQETLPLVGEVMREGWHFLIPFATLIFIMFYWQTSPELAAIGATLAMFVVGSVRSYKGYRLRLPDFIGTMCSTGRNTSDLFMTLAGAGIVIGVLNATGLAYALTLILVKIAGENMFWLLAVAAVISIILGMGMPTTAVYVLLATLIAPSLIQSGVPKMGAHMFILYFGMLSMITPPVALAAFAAANISKAGVMETGWAACRIGWAKFVLPFMFVFSPTLLMIGHPAQVVYDAAIAFAAVYIVSVGVVGFFQDRLAWPKRILLMAIGGVALFPSASIGVVIPVWLGAVAVAAGGVVLGLDYMVNRKNGPMTGTAA